MKNEVDYSKYRCPYDHIEKDGGHELHGPDGFENVYGVWCACGFRGPVFCRCPEDLKLKLKKELKMEKIKLTDLHYHELLDRASVAMDHFYEHVEKHVAAQANIDIKVAAENVTSAMYNFYNLCSGLADDENRANIYEYEED